ncbi:MAG: PIG-L family deacetylase [Caldilineaceae bacterium]
MSGNGIDGQTRTLLGIFAHPDDESFGPGGTLAKYAAEGVNVHIIIGTDGIAGSVEKGTNLPGHQTLAQIRSTELSNAAVALGVTSIWSLPYRDSGMRGAPENDHPKALVQQPLNSLSEEIADYMQRLRPQVVITHDPNGGYGHPDHIHICQATTTAFYQLAVKNARSNGDGQMWPSKLYYTAFDKRLLRVMVRLMPLYGQDPTAFGRNKDINFVEIAKWETPINARIDTSGYLSQKTAASMAHASQYSGGPSYIRLVPPFLRQRWLSSDTFTRAYPAPDKTLETDLFAGLR